MNRLETIRIIVQRHRLSDGDYADIRLPGADLERLLVVAEAVGKLPEPSHIDRHGRMVCAICHADVVMGQHRPECFWLAVTDALAPLGEVQE